ncbi:DUF1563 domain-containing protein [Leptospira kirschneri]|uniref:DUF1563 domain-containing protein n=1 Tax=Leptospira kirschneri TaxID=29507 RepID=UPI0003804B9D|nr:DUF1563 domain-containing protein [Leptospira kirschneri]
MNIVLTILTSFFLLENLYTSYVEYFLKQTSLDNVQKISKTNRKQNKMPILLIFKILISPIVI